MCDGGITVGRCVLIPQRGVRGCVAFRLIEPAVERTGWRARRASPGRNPRKKLIQPAFFTADIPNLGFRGGRIHRPEAERQ